MDQPNYLFGYVELLASLAVTLLALRSSRFWICFPLGLLGAALLFDAAYRGGPGEITRFVAVVGASLLVIGLLGRKRAIAPPLTLVGLHLLLYSLTALWAQNFYAPIIGLALLVIAAISPRLPFGPLLAILGWVSVSSLSGVLYGEYSGGHQIVERMFSSPSGWMGNAAVVLATFVALLWLAPDRAWTRMALYAILLLVIPVYMFFLENFVLTSWTATLIAVAAGGGISMALLRQRLFGDHLVQRAVAPMPASPAPSPARQPAAEPSSATAPIAHAPADIFISYKREERGRVEAIAHALRELKLNVWFDARLQSGNSFDDEINREVRAAKCVLVCWSPGSIASEWVRAEASIGRQRGVLAACFLDQCELYPPFNLVHAEDLSAGALDGANPSWAKIVEQIGHLVGRPGLGAYVLAQGERAALGAWLADHAADPLAEIALARLRQS